MNIKPLSFKKLKTVPLASRKAEADGQDFGAPFHANGSFADFLCSLPELGAASDLFHLRDILVSAHRRGRNIIVGCGGHVMDAGLSPLLIRLIEQKVISALVMTGASMLQDVEIALVGHTIAYHEQERRDGHFCVTEETGRLINEAIQFGATENWGIGQSVGQKLLDSEPEHLDHSVLATACRYSIPVSVHPAIGADAFNLHPAMNGESLGATAYTDFRLLTAVFAASSGGVLVNIASSVVLPRVFLQAMDAASNLGKKVESLTTAIIDSSASSPAIMDLDRRSKPDGCHINLPGPGELLLPLLFAAVLNSLGDEIEQ